MRRLLPPDVEWKEYAWQAIVSSGWFAARLSVMSTSDEALEFYRQVESIPQTSTRAEVLECHDLKIDGIMHVTGVQTAMFFYAFKITSSSYVPKVIKVPREVNKVEKECLLYEAIKDMAESDEIALVPVSALKMKGQQARDGSAVKIFNRGILMPIYATTLNEIPLPVSNEYALMVFSRLSKALSFLHNKNWLHGDIKPSNIFIDHLGATWIGDYGSSVEHRNIKEFTGGTPAYQCTDIQAIDNLYLFDKVGLVITLLEKLDYIGSRGRLGFEVMTYEILRIRIYQMDEKSELRREMLSLLRMNIETEL